MPADAWEAAAHLPTRVRQAARGLLVDDSGAVLLIHDSDVGRPPGPDGVHPSWWITPGGGIDAGETPAVAAQREIREETGLRLASADLVGPVWHHHVRYVFSDHRSEQEEWFFLVRAARFEPDTGGFTEGEQASILGFRWWDPLALTRQPLQVLPAALPGLLPALLDDPAPALRELPATEVTPGVV